MAKDDFDDLSMDMFEEFDIDVEPDKKKGKIAQAAEAVASLLKDTAKGAAKGISKEVGAQFRDIGEAYQEAIDTVDDFQRLKSDITQELGPATNTLKQITLRMLPKAKSFIPEKYYKSISEKLKSSINPPEMSAAQREAQMKQDTIREALNSIFQQQVQMQQAQATQDATNLQVDRQVGHIRFKAQSEAMASLDSKLFTITDFLTGTFTGYIKKSLELKYNHLFIARDTFNAVRGLAKIVEARLIDIQKNTGLPDFAKQSAMHQRGAGALKRGANQLSSDFFASFRQNTMKNLRQAVMSPLQMITQQMIPMLDLGAQMSELGGPMTTSSILGLVGGIGGNIGGSVLARKFFNNNQNLTDLINAYTKGLKSRAQSKLEDWADRHRGFGGGPLGFLANLIPKFNRDTTVRNTLMEDQFETVPFDAITRQTIVEIIPAHLENIAKYVTGMALSLAPQGKYENITFDKTTRTVETAATAREHYINYYSGGEATRMERGKDILDRVKVNTLSRSGETEHTEIGKNLIKNVDDREVDLKKFIHNSSWYHQSFKVHELINWYNTDEQTEYIQKVFDNVEDPRGLCELLLSSVAQVQFDSEGERYFDPNTINSTSLTNIENLIIDHFSDTDYIRKNADSINPTGDARIYGDLIKGNVMTNVGAQNATIKKTDKQYRTVFRDGKQMTTEEMEAAGISTGESLGYGATNDQRAHQVTKKEIDEALRIFKDQGIPENDPIITEWLLSTNPLRQTAAVLRAKFGTGVLGNIAGGVINNFDKTVDTVKSAGEKVREFTQSEFDRMMSSVNSVDKLNVVDSLKRRRKQLVLAGLTRDGLKSITLMCNEVDGDGIVRGQKQFKCTLSKSYPVSADFKMMETDIRAAAAKNKVVIDKPITDITVVGNWAADTTQPTTEVNATATSAEVQSTSVYDGLVEDMTADHPFMDDTTWTTINENIPFKLQQVIDAINELGKADRGFIEDGSQMFSKGGRIGSSKMRKLAKQRTKSVKSRLSGKTGDHVTIKANDGEYVLNQDQMKNLQKLTGTSSDEEAFKAVREGKYSKKKKNKIDKILKATKKATTPADVAKDVIPNSKLDTTGATITDIKNTIVEKTKPIVSKVDQLLASTIFDKLPDKYKSDKYRKIWDDAIKKGKSIPEAIDTFAKAIDVGKQGKEVLDKLKRACLMITNESDRNELIAKTLATLSTMKSTVLDKEKRKELLDKAKADINDRMKSISEKAMKAYESAKKDIEEKGVFGGVKSQLKKGWEWFKKTKFYKFVSDHIPEETKKQIKDSFIKAKGEFSEAFNKAKTIVKDKVSEESKPSEIATSVVPETVKAIDTSKVSASPKKEPKTSIISKIGRMIGIGKSSTEQTDTTTNKEENVKLLENKSEEPKTDLTKIASDISIPAPKLETSKSIAIEATPLPTSVTITPETKLATAVSINQGAVETKQVPVTDITPTKSSEPIQGPGALPGKTILSATPGDETFSGEADSNFHRDFRLFALRQFEYNERMILAAASKRSGGGGGLLGSVVKGAGSAIGGGLNYIGQAVNGFYKGAGTAIGGIGQGLGNLGAAMFNSGFFGDLAKGMGSAIGGIGQGMGTAAGGFYKGVGTAISGTAKGLGSAIEGMFGGGGQSRLGGFISDAVTKLSRPKYIDVYIKGKIDLGNPALSAKEQEEGVYFMDGKRLENTTDLKAPVYKTDKDGNKKLVITQQDLEAGLVDAQGKDINSKAGGEKKSAGPFSGKGFSGLLSGLLAGGGMLAQGIGSLYKGLFSGAGSLIKGTAKVASTALGRMFGIDTEGTQAFQQSMITRFDKIIALLEGSAYINTSKEEVEKEKADLKEAEDKRAAEENKDRDAALKYQQDKDAAEAKAKKDAENAAKSQNAQEQLADINAKDKEKYATTTIAGGKVSQSVAERAKDATPSASEKDGEGGLVDDVIDEVGDTVKNKAIKFARNKVAAKGIRLLRKTKWGRKLLRSKAGKYAMKGVNWMLKKPGAAKSAVNAATKAGKATSWLSKGTSLFSKGGSVATKAGGLFTKAGGLVTKAAPWLTKAAPVASAVGHKAAAVAGKAAAPLALAAVAYGGIKGFTASEEEDKKYVEEVGKEGWFKRMLKTAINPVRQGRIIASTIRNAFGAASANIAASKSAKKAADMLQKMDEKNVAKLQSLNATPEDIEKYKTVFGKDDKESYALRREIMNKYRKPSVPSEVKPTTEEKKDQQPSASTSAIATINEWKDKPSSPERTAALKKAGVDFPDDPDDVNNTLQELTLKQKAEVVKPTQPASDVASDGTPVEVKPESLKSGNKALDGRVALIQKWKDQPDSPERTRALKAAGIENANNREAIDGRLIDLTKRQHKHITESGGTIPDKFKDIEYATKKVTPVVSPANVPSSTDTSSPVTSTTSTPSSVTQTSTPTPKPAGDTGRSLVTATKQYTGQLIGNTLIPNQGESKDDYEKRRTALQQRNDRIAKLRRRRSKPVLSIYTKEGQDSYKAAKTMSAQMRGGSYNADEDPVLKMIAGASSTTEPKEDSKVKVDDKPIESKPAGDTGKEASGKETPKQPIDAKKLAEDVMASGTVPSKKSIFSSVFKKSSIASSIGKMFGFGKKPNKHSDDKKTGEKYPEWWGSDHQKSMFVNGAYVEKTNGHLAGEHNFGEHLTKGYKLFESHKANGTLDELFKQFEYTPDEVNDSSAPKFWRKQEEEEANKPFNKAKAALSAAGEWTSEKFNQLKDKASEAWTSGKEKLGDAITTGKEKAVELATKAGTTIKEGWDAYQKFGRKARRALGKGAKKVAQTALLGANQIGTWITDPESFKSDMKDVGAAVKQWWDEPGIGTKMLKGAKQLGLKAQMGLEKVRGLRAKLDDKIYSGLINMGEGYNNLRDRSIEGVKAGWDLAKTTGQNALNWTKDTAKDLYGKGKDAVEAAKQYGLDVYTGGKLMAQEALDKGKELYGKGKDAVIKAADWTKNAATNVWDFYKGGGLAGYAWRNRDKIKQWGMDKLSQAKEWGSEKLDQAKQYASDVWTGAKDIASEKYNQAKEALGSAWDKTKQFGKDVLTGGKAMLSEGWDKAKGFFGNLWKKTKQKAAMGVERIKALPSKIADKGLSTLINMGEGYNKLKDRSIEGIKTGWDVVSLTGKNMLASGKEWLNETWDKAKHQAIRLGLKTKQQWLKFQRLPNDIKLKVLDGTISAIEAIADKVGLEADEKGRLHIKKDKPKTEAKPTPAAKAKSATPKIAPKSDSRAYAKGGFFFEDSMEFNYTDFENYLNERLPDYYGKPCEASNVHIPDKLIEDYYAEKFPEAWNKLTGSQQVIETGLARTRLDMHFEDRKNVKPDKDGNTDYGPGVFQKPLLKATSKSTPVTTIKDTKRGGGVTTAADKTTSDFARHDSDKAEALKQQAARVAADVTKPKEDTGSKDISNSIINSGNAQLSALDRIAGLLERQIVATEGVGEKTKKQADEAGINAVAMSQKATEAMVSPLRPKPKPTQPKPPAIDVNKTVLA